MRILLFVFNLTLAVLGVVVVIVVVWVVVVIVIVLSALVVEIFCEPHASAKIINFSQYHNSQILKILVLNQQKFTERNNNIILVSVPKEETTTKTLYFNICRL